MRNLKIRLNVSSIFWGTCFIALCLPLHASNALLSYLSISGSITIFHLIFLVIAFYIFLISLSRSKKSVKTTLINFLFFIFIVLGYIIGFKNGTASNSIIGDGSSYLLAFTVLYCISNRKIKEKNLPDLLEFLTKATFISCLISIIMFLTPGFSLWRFYSYNNGRYFGGYLSLLIFTMPFALYKYINENKTGIVKLAVYELLGFICIFLSQTRTILVFAFLGLILVLLLGNNKKAMSFSSFVRILIVFIIITVGTVILLNSSNLDIISRLENTNLTSSDETIFARIYIYQYYFSQIFKNFWGVGFGKPMYFITKHMRIMITSDVTSYTVDSALMTAGYKGGVCFLIFYVFASILPLYTLLKKFINTKNRLYFIYSIIWGFFVFQTVFITAQIIHTIATLIFFWIINGLVIKDRY